MEKSKISRMPNLGFEGSNVIIVGILTPQHKRHFQRAQVSMLCLMLG